MFGRSGSLSSSSETVVRDRTALHFPMGTSNDFFSFTGPGALQDSQREANQ